MKYTPLFDNVLIKVEEQKSQTASGILLPEKAKDMPSSGTVMAVGTGKLNEQYNLIPMQVKVGDKVLYKKWVGMEIKGEDGLILLKQDELLAII